MIIDKILDRKDGIPYNSKDFYNYCNTYMQGLLGHDIATALDSGENVDIQKQLERYILAQNYNVDIVKYIKSVDWISNN